MPETISTRRSEQKDAILSVLRSGRLNHPSADEVYFTLRKRFPNISLGTVYRNLSLLSSLGEISKVEGADGFDRFDQTLAPHAHFKCNTCGEIFDAEIDNSFFKKLSSDGFCVDTISVVLRGKCSKCAKKKNLKPNTKGKK